MDTSKTDKSPVLPPDHRWTFEKRKGIYESDVTALVRRMLEDEALREAMADGVPVLGVVHVPALQWTYAGQARNGAQVEKDGNIRPITTASWPSVVQPLRVVASRSHRGDKLDDWLAFAQQRHAGLELVSMGSSLKICLVAEGKADIYPRLALTSEWDTAAAQAVLEAAGGTLVDTSAQVYRYNRKEDLLNPFFFNR